jgi:hypothetical protein
MFTVSKASVPSAWRIDLMPSRVKVFVLMDSRVISRNKTNDCEPRRKEVVVGHTIHLLDVNIYIREFTVDFQSEAAEFEAVTWAPK